MPPRKRDRENEGRIAIKAENNSGDHEQFLQAFEKPTQIYRYLRTRSMLKPVFLYRTLSYMKHRMSRTHKNRKNFKVDSLLQTVTDKMEGDPPISEYLTLFFLGFFDKTSRGSDELVKVETLITKLCHKKRKEVTCPSMTVSLGTNYVPFNPSEVSPPAKVQTVSIPTENLSIGGHTIKSYFLQIKVVVSELSSDNDSEPSQKKRKSIKQGDEDRCVIYGTNLVIYDRQKRCMLPDGDYEFYLEEVADGSSNRISQALSSWEDVEIEREFRDQHLTNFESICNGPVIKFRLSWSKDPVTPIVDRPLPLVPRSNNNLELSHNNNNNNKEVAKVGSADARTKAQFVVTYYFHYNQNSKQQTESSFELNCPWCSIHCKVLYSLLKHLKLCHSRFNFNYVPVQGGARINVTLNEGYDGSYCGVLGPTPRGTGPSRRTPLSHVIVCHPKRPQFALTEFMDIDENEFDPQRAYITGHNRLYHHTTTCLPVLPKEMDYDSEDETDPRWLQKKTMMMIDDFTDVNEGEKELMKMWNLHVMRHGFVGDCQIPLACTMFLQQKGKELLMKNLYKNFVLHMCNLFDFGLVSPVAVFNIMQKVQETIQTDPEVSTVLQDSWTQQRNQWNTVDQKPWIQETVESPGGERRKPETKKPSSDKKRTPSTEGSKNNGSPTPLNGLGEKRKQPPGIPKSEPSAKRRLSLPSKPDLRKKLLKEPPPMRRRSFTATAESPKKKTETSQ